MSRLKSLVILIWLSFSSSLFSQYVIKNHLNLLPKKNTPCYCITQDKKGYIWLGSKDGLVKFDGKTAQVFNQKDGLPNSKITSVYCDTLFNVWVGTDLGKVYWLKQNLKVDSLIFKDEIPETKITGFYKAGTKLFVATYGNGIYIFENGKQAGHLTSKTGLSDDVIYTLKFIDNKLWCGTDAGITVIGNLPGKLSLDIISTKLGLPDNIVRSIHPYAGSKLVIGMQDSGVCFFDINKKQFDKIVFFNNWDKGPVINCLISDNGEIVFATEKKGLFLFTNGQLHSDEFLAGLKTNSFSQLFIDQSNAIWLTSDVGAHQIIEKRFEIINSAKGLPDEKILSIICDNDQTLWAGTSAGIIKLNKNESYNFSVSVPSNFPKATVSCSAIDKNDALYFGTYISGLIVMKDGKLLNFTTKNSPLTNDNISNIFIDKDKIYVSTLGGGLIICQLEGEKLTVLKNYTEANGLKSDYIYSTLITDNNELYVASDGGGLEKLVNEKFQSLNKSLKLTSTTIYSLVKDSKGNIWGVTNLDGVIKYSGKTLTSFKAKSGLRDEAPQQIIEYNGTMYLIHSKGIDKIDIATSQVSYYDILEGDLEPNLNSVYIKDGTLYSALNIGILSYRIKPEHSDKIKPIALITKLLVNYKTSSQDSSHNLTHNQNNLSIEFSGIWTKNPEKLLYRYMLKGLNTDWETSSFAKMVNYNNLDAGEYVFIVQSKNDEDVWSDPVEFKFSVALPIWKRPLFWIILVLVVGLSVYWFIKWRIKALKKENLILEEKVAQRTSEIEKQSEIIAEANKELEQLSIVASKTDNVVVILSPNGDIEYVNESFQKLNRITLKEILAQKLNIFTSSNNPEIKSIVEDAVANRKSVNYESFNDKDPDNKVWEASTLTPIYDENSNLRKIIIIDSDITESKRQQKIIEEKHREITDSINYAERIQRTFLATTELLNQNFKDYFVFFQPKDVVSGDFYWASQLSNGNFAFATADSTGHGVPGAIMSLLNITSLEKATEHHLDPADILNHTRKTIIERLKRDGSAEGGKDGMDCSLICFDFKNKQLQIANANNPVWIVRGKEIIEIKPDKMPVGKHDKDKVPFTLKTLDVMQGDVVYALTDGYPDQFGGEKGKKFMIKNLKILLQANAHLPMQEQRQILETTFKNWVGGFEQVDDVAVVGVRI